MATKKTDALTAVTNAEKMKDGIPRVSIYLPERESTGDVAVDQYEHVTIGGETTLIRRGEHVQVTVPVYLQLRNRFPHL